MSEEVKYMKVAERDGVRRFVRAPEGMSAEDLAARGFYPFAGGEAVDPARAHLLLRREPGVKDGQAMWVCVYAPYDAEVRQGGVTYHLVDEDTGEYARLSVMKDAKQRGMYVVDVEAGYHLGAGGAMEKEVSDGSDS